MVVGPATVILLTKLFEKMFFLNSFFSNSRGPNEAVLVGSDQPRVNATTLTKGLYVFQLTAWDDSGVSASDNVTVNVLQRKFFFSSTAYCCLHIA